MAALGAWLKKHLEFRTGPKLHSDDQLPFLSSPRRPITPTSFDEPSCLFFQLPWDIRSLIYAMAFGGRILHMDINREKEAWTWRGAVCVRVPPMPCYRHRLCNDTCLRKAYIFDRNRREQEGFHLGIMGFLLSCKQAYTEVIDVLYDANCISIQSEPLLINLPQLVSKNRLESITSLEVVLTAHRKEHSIVNGSCRPSFHLDHLEIILENIAAYFHQLCAFRLSFLVSYRLCAILDGPTLPLVDSFYRSKRLRNMQLELPEVTYWRLFESDPDHPHEASARIALDSLLWRSLDSVDPKTQWKSSERYPYPLLRLPLDGADDDGEESAGYWLLEGDGTSAGLRNIHVINHGHNDP